MRTFREKVFLAFAFFAASVFVSLSVGGEFLHSHVHHHQTQSSQDDCPVYQFLVQAFLFAVAAALGFVLVRSRSAASTNILLLSFPQYRLPGLRAPPVIH